MPARTLADADPLPYLLEHLRGHDGLTQVLGGPGRVGGLNEPPYPRVVLSDPPGGDLRYGRWLIASPVQVEVFGDPDHSTSKALLKRVMLTVLGVLARVNEVPYDDPDRPVITAVGFTGVGGWSPTPQGQPRYVAVPTVTVHPPHPTVP